MGLRDRLDEFYERWDTWAENHRLPNWALWLLGRLGLPAFLVYGLYIAARRDWFEDGDEEKSDGASSVKKTDSAASVKKSDGAASEKKTDSAASEK